MSGPKSCSTPALQLLLPAALPRALMTPEFLFFLVFHLVFFGMFCSGALQEGNRLEWERIRAISAITVTLELFFANQCYWRFTKIRALLRGMMGAVYEFAYLTRLFIRPCGKPYDHCACRFVVAATLLFLIDANGSGVSSDREWDLLLQLGLLKRDEVRFFGGLVGSQRLLVMIHVATDMARTGLAEAEAAPEAAGEISASMIKYRETQQELQALLDAGVPFAYEHMLTVLVIATLALWAYAMAFHGSFFSPLIFVCAELLLLGLLEVGSELLHPFKRGNVSLPKWALAFLQNVDAVLEYAHTFAETNYDRDLAYEAEAGTEFTLSLKDVEDFFGIREKRATPATRLDGSGEPSAEQDEPRQLQLQE